MVCYHGPRNTFGQLWMLGFSNQTIISKLRTIERVYKWLNVKKDNIFLNTKKSFAMIRYSTYKDLIISLDQVVTKKQKLFDFDVNTNRFPLEFHTFLLTKKLNL